MISVSAIYVSFNRCEQMRQFHHQNAQTAGRKWDELIWVDNGSSDSTPAMALSLFPDKIILSNRNLGFERAANLAFAAASCDWIILICTNFGPPNWLKMLCDIAETGEVDLISLYGPPTSKSSNDNSERWLQGEHKTIAGHPCRPGIPLEFVLFNRKVLDQIGYFREDFSYGWGDVDWAFRTGNRRLRSYVMTDAHVTRIPPPPMQVVEPNGEILEYADAKFKRINEQRNQSLLSWCFHKQWPYYNPFHGPCEHPFGTVEKFQAK